MRPELQILVHPPFRRLFLARTLSLLGSAMAPVALAFAVLDQTHGAVAKLGIVLFARAAAQLAFLLPGGILADRISRRQQMLAAEVLSGCSQAAMAALFLTHSATVPSLVACAAVHGFAEAMFLPASVGILPSVVPRDQLQPANALIGSSISAVTIVGSLVAGLLVATIGAGWAIAADAATYLGSAVLLAGMRIVPAVIAASGQRASVFSDLREGWQAFSSRQWVWVIVLQFSLINMCFNGGFYVLGPEIARRSLGGAPAWAAILACDGAGLLIGNLAGIRLRPRRPIRFATLATFGFVPPFVMLGIGAPLWLVGTAALVTGMSIAVFDVQWSTALQVHIPERALSRVSSYDMLGSFMLGPLGMIAVGPVATHIGFSQTLIGGAVLMAAMTALALLSPSVRNLPA